jgi:integrase
MSTFKKTGVSNLELHVATGTYYARIKTDGNTIRKALGTNRAAAITAKDKWVESIRGKKSKVEGTLGSCVELYHKWLGEQSKLKEISERTHEYKMSLLPAIRKTWQPFDLVSIADLTKTSIRGFQLAMVTDYGATRVNGAMTVLREVFDRAVEANMLSRAQRDELLEDLKFVKVDLDYKRRLSKLPCHADLLLLKAEVEKRCKNKGEAGFWLFNFLLLSGCRVDSARHLLWTDVDFTRNEIYFRTAKYGPYSIPMFPELKELLEQRKTLVGGNPEERVLPTKTLQSVLTASCKHLGLPHLSHHDLRHLFATRCIESGKDFVTVAAWLGHKDNGRTVMAVYGHLRREHSQREAASMTFLPKIEPKKVNEPQNEPQKATS